MSNVNEFLSELRNNPLIVSWKEEIKDFGVILIEYTKSDRTRNMIIGAIAGIIFANFSNAKELSFIVVGKLISFYFLTF